MDDAAACDDVMWAVGDEDGDVAVCGDDEGDECAFLRGGCDSKRAKELTGSVLLGSPKLGVGEHRQRREKV